MWGAPVGGSLGKCAVCGETFLAGILIGSKSEFVASFSLGDGQQFAAHSKCIPVLQASVNSDGEPDPAKLPAASPLKPELERFFAERAAIVSKENS